MSHDVPSEDPIVTDPDKYSVVFENDQVRVLEYQDQPGACTRPHHHPNSVMVTLSSFQRRLHLDDQSRDVSIPTGFASWLPAQSHSGENIGQSDTHVIFVELNSADGTTGPPGVVGPEL
jgi:hypothetical protein